MEVHRLKPMPDNYDRALFNVLYKNTERLRKKLASEIDPRRFGVDYKIILSWFDDKFIYAFTKYYSKSPDVLKGYIINSLRVFKFRVLKEAYANKNLHYRNAVDISSESYFDILTSDLNHTEENLDYNLLNLVTQYLKDNLSDDAYLIFEIELAPPLYIMQRLDNFDKKTRDSIPNELLADYLGLPYDDKVNSYIGSLRRDVKNCINEAREYFKSQPISV